MKLLIVDEFYKIRRAELICNANGRFIPRLFEIVMGNPFTIPNPEENTAEYEGIISEMRTNSAELLVESIPVGHFENSDLGFIYVFAPLSELRALNEGDSIYLRLEPKSGSKDIFATIDLTQLAYGIETDLPPTMPVAWLVAEPGPGGPCDLMEESYVVRSYLRTMGYERSLISEQN